MADADLRGWARDHGLAIRWPRAAPKGAVPRRSLADFLAGTVYDETYVAPEDAGEGAAAGRHPIWYPTW